MASVHYNPQKLEERLIDFGTRVCELLRRIPKDLVTKHLSQQLIRSGTSPAANYAEARGAESRRDFIHKMQLCVKELRETSIWLRFAHRLCGRKSEVRQLTAECNELISIFVSSINTAKATRNRHGR